MKIAPPQWLIDWVLGTLIDRGKNEIRQKGKPISITYNNIAWTSPTAVGAKPLEVGVGYDENHPIRLVVFVVKD